MGKDEKTPNAKRPPSDADTEKKKRKDELSEAALDKVAGGALGGDDDLDDLEVERLRRR